MKYSPVILMHFHHPCNVGNFEARDLNTATGVAGTFTRGDIIQIQIKVKDHTLIEEARFKAYGSVVTIAAASFAAQWLQNKSIAEADQLDSCQIAQNLQLPGVKMHCALLAQDAVKAAIMDYRQHTAHRIG